MSRLMTLMLRDTIVFKTKKMTNEPNFKISKTAITHFLSKANDYSPRTNNDKNEPKRSQL